MNRKIEKQMIENVRFLLDGQSWSSSNTIVNCENGIVNIYLHGNNIATIDRKNKKVTLSSCGWQTVTTKSRLNTICTYLRIPGIYQKNFEWLLTNGKKFFDGITIQY